MQAGRLFEPWGGAAVARETLDLKVFREPENLGACWLW